MKKKNIRRTFLGIGLIAEAVLVIVLAFMLSDRAAAVQTSDGWPDDCPWEYREGWTCVKTDWGWSTYENTPGPTPPTYPGPGGEPTPVDPCSFVYPGPECGVVGEAVQAEAVQVQVDNPEPTPTAVNPFIGLPHPGRHR